MPAAILQFNLNLLIARKSSPSGVSSSSLDAELVAKGNMEVAL